MMPPAPLPRRRRFPAAALATLLGLLVLAALSLAWAAAPRSLAVYVEGPSAVLVRPHVQALVPATLGAVDLAAFAAALRRAGGRAPASGLLDARERRDTLLERLRKAADDTRADLVLVGRTRTRPGGGKELWLVLVDVKLGSLLLDETVALPVDEGERRAALEAVLRKPLAEVAPPPASASTPVSASPSAPAALEDKGEGPGRKPNDEATALVAVGAGVDLGGRWFSYREGGAGLRSYGVFPAPLLTLSGEVYPAATTGVPVVQDLGLRARFGYAVGLRSATAGGQPISTHWSRFTADLHGRLRTGRGFAPVLGLGLGFDWNAFWFVDAGALAGELPTVSYQSLRVGLDVRVPLGPVSVGLDGAYLRPFAAGEVHDRFPGASVHGLDLGLGLSIGGIDGGAAGFRAQLGAAYTRYFASFEPAAGGALGAAGATDQMLAIRLGAAYVH